MTTKEIEDLEKEILQLEAEGKNISISNKMKLKKLQKKRDKLSSPIEPSAVFISQGNIKESIQFIQIDKIQMPDFNDRTGIDAKKIEELAQSIKENGLLQPIVVSENSDGSFLKISGRRRILATTLNGEDMIKAIIKREDLTKRQFNLLVLHENTQREDLSIYDKVRFMLNFIEQEFDIELQEAIKLCHKVNNYKKGNIVQKDIEIEEKVKIVDTLLLDTKIFSSIATFVKHLLVLDMNPEILRYLDNNRITFNMALIFNQYKDKKFIENQDFSSIIQNIVSNQMSINEAKKYFQDLLYKEENELLNSTKNIKTKLSRLNKIALSLKDEKLKIFEEELEKLILAYQVHL